jgi:hypothetical protein
MSLPGALAETVTNAIAVVTPETSIPVKMKVES